MSLLPNTTDTPVIRTDFDNEHAWKAVCELIRAPVHEGGETFYAYAEFVEDRDLRDLTVTELLACVPENYRHSIGNSGLCSVTASATRRTT